MASLRFWAFFFAMCAALALHAQAENRGLTLGPEIWASEPEFVRATAWYGSVAAASNGDDFLVLWAGSEGIHAQRIAADGTPTTRHGTIVPGATASAHGFAVDSSGDGYLVVWRQNDAIWSALIPDDRTAAIESRLVMESANSVAQLVASNDGYLLVVTLGHEVRGMLLDERGQSASALFVIASGAAMDFGISGASDGTDYMLTYTISGVQDAVHSQRVTATGEVGFANRLTEGKVYRSRIGHNGTSYVLVWIQYADAVAPRGVYSARLDRYGFFIDSPRHISNSPTLGLMDDASAVLLEHENERGLLRLTASGAPAPGVPVVIGLTPSIRAFAASRTHYLFVTPERGLRYVVAPRSLEYVSSPRDVAISPSPHSDVRVFSAGQMNVVLWLEQTASDEWHIYASRIAHGRPLDGRGLLVSRHKNSGGTPPVWMAASDDHHVLVAWVEATEVRGALIGAGGLAIQNFPLMALPPEYQRPEFHSLVWTGTYYALLWSTAKSSAQRMERIQHFRLFTATGVFVSDGTFAPQVGCNGIACNTARAARTAVGVLLIYSRDGDIFAAPLGSDLSPAGFPVLVAGTPSEELPTAVASDGSGRVVIAWSVGTRVFDHPAAPLSYTYFFRILDARGVAVSDAVSVTGSPFDAVWIGDSFLASLLGPAIIRITRDGRLMDPPAGSLGGRGDYRPVLAHGPSGTVVAYAGSTAGYGVGDSRVAMIRTILDGGRRRRSVRF